MNQSSESQSPLSLPIYSKCFAHTPSAIGYLQAMDGKIATNQVQSPREQHQEIVHGNGLMCDHLTTPSKILYNYLWLDENRLRSSSSICNLYPWVLLIPTRQ